ncbi:MAG: EamA family transporter [Treponemataceae bacterium]
MKQNNVATIYAILAAALYAISVPLSKIILRYLEPVMMSAFLYLGAGLGLLIYSLIKLKVGDHQKRETLTKNELPYTISMVLLDIIAPILLMIGITKTTSANVSLLNNFEIVVTAIIALVIFKEAISRRLWFAIILVTIASFILSFEGTEAFTFNEGSLFVLGACVC